MGEPHPDLKFDHAAATAAIHELNAVIGMLKSQTNGRAGKAKTMGPPNWTGTYSNKFYDTELPRMKKEAGTLVGKLQALVSKINTASRNATDYANENNTWHQTHNPHPTPKAQPPPTPGG